MLLQQGFLFILFFSLYIMPLYAQSAIPDKTSGASLYQQHCAQCHGENRLGLMAPALIPANLRKVKKDQAIQVITQGRSATQMPAFKNTLSAQAIQQLVDYIYTPLATLQWGETEIRQTHKLYKKPPATQKPLFETTDPLNLFIVVELADHHVSLLDGGSFEVIHRFPSHRALHGGPKYSANGRYVYFASRDGWISVFDIYTLQYISEIRVGINTRNLAVSADGKYVMVANTLPRTLVILNAKDLSLVKIIAIANDYQQTSRASAVYTAPPRNSFIVALKDFNQVWEIFYNDNPPPVYNGLMHDYQLREGVVQQGTFPVQRIKLDNRLDDFFFDPKYNFIIGTAREENNKHLLGGQVINLNIRRKVADIPLSGMPHLGSGISWKYKNTRVLATPNLQGNKISIIDMQNWQLIKEIKTLGPGFFMRSHENSPYAWVDVFFGKNKDKVHIIDKQTLKIVKTLQPVPGKTSGHIEFTRDGKYALLSIWDNDGALIIYDAKTLKEIKRIPMKKPSGKYNVYNKTRLSEGTSH